MQTLESYVCGGWRAGKGPGEALVNPTTEEVIATASSGGLDPVAVLEHGRRVGGPALRALTFADRGALLKRMSQSLHGARDALIEASVVNGGTTRSDAKFDVDGAIGTLAYYAGVGERLGARTVLVEGAGEQLTRGPRFWGHHVASARLGVALHINAFNFPAWGLAEKAAVALLAGVPVVTKPATATALVAHEAVRRLVADAALPDGALQLVCGSARELLPALGSQDVLAFTGSGSVGATLRSLENVVARSVRVNVEADSLNAVVLAPDVEPGSDTYLAFLRDVTREMTQKTGQKCTASRRLFVPAAVIDRVEADLAERLGRVRVGAPTLEEVTTGPLATAAQRASVRAGIALLAWDGARPVFGSATEVAPIGAVDGRGYFIAPVLLRADAPATAHAVHAHEVFGPVSTLMPYRTTGEATELVARGDGGLVCALYGDDRAALGELLFGLAPWHGRVLLGSAKVADQAIGPGLVLPSCVHGGPGRAGGGEELGGERGLGLYLQRTAVQGDRALLERLLGLGGPAVDR